MDIGELHRRGNEILDIVESRMDPGQWRSAHSLLNHGEEEEFLDLLLAVLVEDRIAVDRNETELVRQLLASFPVHDYDAGLYSYLTDPRVVERLTIVE